MENTNQKLPSDDIRALAWHPTQRKLYIGTSRGLAVLNASSPLPPELNQVDLEPLSDDQTISKSTIYSLVILVKIKLYGSVRLVV